MHLSQNNHKNILRIIGFIFICVGLIMSYSAIQTVLDANVSIILNGVSRNDAEAKLTDLFIPCIITVFGFCLCLSKGKSLDNLHKARESFWSIFHGK
jgi:hypothetical protein